MLVRYPISSLIMTMAYPKVQPNGQATLALFFVVGPSGPSHGYVISNAFRNDDLMVAS